MDTPLTIPPDMQEQINQFTTKLLTKIATVRDGQLVSAPDRPDLILVTLDGMTASGGMVAARTYLEEHGVPFPPVIEADVGYSLVDAQYQQQADSPGELERYREPFARIETVLAQADNGRVVVVDPFIHTGRYCPEDVGVTGDSATEFVQSAAPQDQDHHVEIELMSVMAPEEYGWQAEIVGEEYRRAFGWRRYNGPERIADNPPPPEYALLGELDKQIRATIDVRIRQKFDHITQKAFPSLSQ